MSGPGHGEVADDNEDADLSPVSFPTIDVTVCSFALHLLDGSSQLWALLSELSWRTTWLIVLEPHKKPEVRTLPALSPTIFIPSELETFRSSRVGVGHNGTTLNGGTASEYKEKELRSLKTGMNHCFWYN